MPPTNIKIDDWEISDPANGFRLHILVERKSGDDAAGAASRLEMRYLGHVLSFEPAAVKRWAGRAAKLGRRDYFLKEHSWFVHSD